MRDTEKQRERERMKRKKMEEKLIRRKIEGPTHKHRENILYHVSDPFHILSLFVIFKVQTVHNTSTERQTDKETNIHTVTADTNVYLYMNCILLHLFKKAQHTSLYVFSL